MSKTNDEIDKIILKFEENGFSSNSNTNGLFTFNKSFQKEIYRLDVYFDIWTVEIDLIIDTNICETCFILRIDDIQLIHNIINFDCKSKCPEILSSIAEFIIDLFLFMRRNEIDINSSNEDEVLVINKNLKNEMFLHAYQYDKFIELEFIKEQYSGTAIFTLDEIVEGNTLLMFEKVKDVLSNLDAI